MLDPLVSSKIAAGEVVERPASAVKELIENSLDAGCSRISVEVRDGGVELIRVSDNGVGIHSAEVTLAFQRFATSKISSADDLDEISTLGFRGEALPSIAAVSRVSLVTRAEAEEAGSRVEVRDGELLKFESAGAPRGTTVTVRGLFQNFPARQKFLKSAASETTRIQTVVTRYALAYPEVAFEMESDRGRRFTTPGTGDRREAAAAVYGAEMARNMLEIASSDQDDPSRQVGIRGLVSPPSVNRANRSYVSLFVNRRWILSRVLGVALDQAYHGFMAERRYPIALVDLSVPHDQVDVNAHPTKSEVRFRQESEVFRALQQAVRRTLVSESPVPEVQPHGGPRPATAPESRPAAFWPTAPFDRAAASAIDGPPAAHTSPPQVDGNTGPLAPGPAPVPKRVLPVLRVLGQVQNTYIVAEGPDGVYLIDQHAAHERVVFERVRAEAQSRTSLVQSLLEPSLVELDPRQQELVESQGETVASLGFAIEPFGGGTFLLRGVPGVLGERDPATALLEVLDLMAEGGGFESWEERAAYSVACHAAIRAGKTMAQDEMTALTRQLEVCDQPNTCPHGRPTMIHLSTSQLEREFGRR
jgi:DNA mismatch repair protein MutL